MFRLEDISPLVMVEGAKAVVIKERKGAEMDAEAKKIAEKQIKKATKLPVVWVLDGTEVSFSHDST